MKSVSVVVIANGLAAKIPVAMEGGGYLLHSDCLIPDDTPRANFQSSLRYGREPGTYA